MKDEEYINWIYVVNLRFRNRNLIRLWILSLMEFFIIIVKKVEIDVDFKWNIYYYRLWWLGWVWIEGINVVDFYK